MIPVRRRPATKVVVFQCPAGAASTKALAPDTPARAAGHGGRGSGLVQEDEALGIHVALPHPPLLAMSSHVGTVLLGGAQRLFLCDRPSRRSVLQIVEM